MNKQDKKAMQKNGITLISLVITIILLLILAAVAINLAVDSDGLFSKAGDAASRWNTSVAEEGTALENLMIMANSVGGITPPPSSLPAGWNPDAVVDTVEEGDRIAPIPAGFVASKVSTEDEISEGLVIYQTTTEVNNTNHDTALTSYNQYVWIPVDDINDMVMCSVCKGTSRNLVYSDTTKTLTCTNSHADGTNPTLVGKLYTTYVESGTAGSSGVYTRHLDFTYTGQEYSDTYTGNREPAVVTGSSGTSQDGATKNYHGLADANAFFAQLQGDFSNMAKSVAKYKGFYVGRYEAQANGDSKKGQAVVTSVTNNQKWYGLHNTLRSDPEEVRSTYSQMIWGSQYDQMMKFLEEDATNEPYIGHTDRGLSSSPAESGNAPLDEMSNIFDLEGNFYEWTAEADSSAHRVARGRLLLRRV